ncbi:hypothetical protein QQS21_007452 [Conoideocrella luteorostrata]|uniref:Zn(2)-C6 fungal-type domain-containing protein n=1 Tax=Conoideocrella luteorostrata TaxID=1105319 RepID=A0AAJ0FWZ8_9HYPO|nr:hypothetical protein QQS21_007452 [Conoideocrella luteorostrata]
MFCTLKAANVVGEPYAFEPTPPPFAKKREGKINKAACTNCRTSKLRCSGDPACCRRCSNKSLECQYPSPARSISQRQDQQTQMPTITDATVGDGLAQIESPCGTSYSDGLLDSNHDFAILDLPTPGAVLSPTDDSTNEFISQDLDALPQGPRYTTTNSNYMFELGLSNVDGMAFQSPVSLATPKTLNASGQPLCSCLQQAISVNEAVEMIMWGQKALSSDVYDILQQQKAALAKCEDLIDCQTCCFRSSYIMFMFSMCRRLLETLSQVYLGLSENDDGDKAANTDSGVDQKKRKRSVESRRSYGISIRERRLDDDDESLVLKSLVTIRIKMLQHIISRLDEVVSQYNWPVHKGVCQELQSSLSAKSFK